MDTFCQEVSFTYFFNLKFTSTVNTMLDSNLLSDRLKWLINGHMKNTKLNKIHTSNKFNGFNFRQSMPTYMFNLEFASQSSV